MNKETFLQLRESVESSEQSEATKGQLSSYKVQNAIIMAAGLSSRFAPLSYEKPKGLTLVKGEVLIERQIRQLKAVGIDDITVVVGYKAEEFDYLSDKYSVDLVFNAEYASRNNHASLWLVRDRLSNTYICSSDNYFDKNPFHTYEWRACYSSQFAEGTTDEWCLQVDADGRIENVEVGGEDAWIMIGPAYFDRAFSAEFRQILCEAYPLEENKGKLWETLYLENIHKLRMDILRFDPPIIREFDRIDEALSFDPDLLQNADSQIISRIVDSLGCQKREISELYPIKAGLTNLSCHFRVGKAEYVYRHPGVGTELLVDRRAEFEALIYAKNLGVDGTFCMGDVKEGWKISYFIPNARQLNAHDALERKWAMEKLRLLHQGKGSLSRVFNFLDEGQRYESMINPKVLEAEAGYAELKGDIFSLKDIDLEKQTPLCVTHNDFFSLNILLSDDNEMHVIDWEYAGMGDYSNDYGTFVVTSQLSNEEADQALEDYYGREPIKTERIHNFCFVAYASWCWYVWAVLKEAEGDCVGEWRDIYHRYAVNYCRRAKSLFLEL